MTGSLRLGRWTRRGSVLAAAGAITALTAAAAPWQIDTSVPGSRRIHLIGDSWAAGLYADPVNALGQVAARSLGWGITVDAVSGTGYLNAAGAATYLQRAEATKPGRAELVVVQGGSNDALVDLTPLRSTARRTIDALRARFPAAELLLLGPGPDPEPVTALQRRIDSLLEDAAVDAGVAYVSMLQEHWIPASRAAAVLDPDNHHPTVAGQKYLGLRLAAALRLHFPDVIGT